MAKNGSRKVQSANAATRARAAAAAKLQPEKFGPAASPRPAKRLVSEKAERFTESVIREMTRQAQLHGAMNLAQGFPDFAAPAELKRAAQQAIENDVNQYAITWGARNLRQAIARQARVWQGMEVDPERNITVCCGSTEAMIASLLAVTNPGDEIVCFEPYYENYGPDAILSGARPRFVRLRPPTASAGEWTFDERELRQAFNRHTKAIIVNTPNNPTGKVFRREELQLIGELCRQHNALAITDEIYEHIIYDGAEHISLASLEGMDERTITINGISKTYSVTGWRVGWAIAPAALTDAIRKVHDFLTVGAPAPLQEAAVVGLSLPQTYYGEMAQHYRRRRDRLYTALSEAGFKAYLPKGAYYMMTDIREFGFADDLAFTQYLVKEVGIAAVPGSSFYSEPADGAQQVRFAFCKKDTTLEEAARRLLRVKRSNRRSN
ncbi:MAG TPA: aminotransferase class I/II-fold pyridoxal phosphate-dependent enzyme [Terriglobales bacterium]|nr:aminotransferase class I/II-fold pyridoxal phosphate-dependent enzyme [Terriglobales bacterium]